MKKCLLGLLFLFSIQFVSAQCDLPFGDFEQWDDQTAAFNEENGTDLMDETMINPVGMSPFFRLFFLIFDFNLPEIMANTPEDKMLLELFGFERSENSRTGNYALKLGGDTLIGYTDIATVIGCEDINPAATLSFYWKHFGETEDSLVVQTIIGPNGEDLLQAEFDDPGVAAYVFDSLYVTGEINDEWQWFQTPVYVNNASIGMDSLGFVIGRLGVPDADSYFLIDDIQWNIETPATYIHDLIPFELGQSNDSRIIYPNLDHTQYEFKNFNCFDNMGRKVKSIDVWEDEIDISDLASGHYFLQIITDKGSSTKAFVRM